jgi:hypothetical protein
VQPGADGSGMTTRKQSSKSFFIIPLSFWALTIMVVRQAPIFRCSNWGTRPPASAGVLGVSPSRASARVSSRSLRTQGSRAGGHYTATTRSRPPKGGGCQSRCGDRAPRPGPL